MTKINIYAKNKHKEANFDFNIEREETDLEKVDRERIKKEEAEKKEKEQLIKEEQFKQEKKQKIKEKKKQLQQELDSIKNFDGKKYKDSIDSLKIELALFGAWALIIEEAITNNDEEIKKLANQLKKEVSKLQTKEFPIMRKNYGKLADDLLWEHNIDTKTLGSDYATLELIGGIFANNKNIKDMHNTLFEMLQLLRFDKVIYKWYEYDKDYTTFKIDSLRDNEVVGFGE